MQQHQHRKMLIFLDLVELKIDADACWGRQFFRQARDPHHPGPVLDQGLKE